MAALVPLLALSAIVVLVVWLQTGTRTRTLLRTSALLVGLSTIIALIFSAVLSDSGRIDVDTSNFRQSVDSVNALREQVQKERAPFHKSLDPEKVGTLEVASVYLLTTGDVALLEPNHEGPDKIHGFVYSTNPEPDLSNIASGWKLEKLEANWWAFLGWS